MPLATLRMSGTTSQFSTPNHLPVRPKPAMTSSDQQDPVPVADLPDRLQIALGRDDDAVCPGDRLEDDRGDGVRALVLEDLFEVRPAGADRAGVGMSRGTAVGVRIEHAHDAGNARLGGPAAGIAGERDRASGRAVVRAVARD